MKILIIGGGIGGLTTALCCLQFGHEVMVFERAGELGEVGAGLQISPNAMKVFGTLGLTDRLLKKAFAPNAIEMRMGESGRVIFNIPLADHAKTRWGAPYLHIHRADYIDILKDALLDRAPEALHLNAEAASYQQNPDEIVLTLKDDREFSGDVLIGADGIHSAIRAQMLGEDKPRFTGNVAWRAVIPAATLGAHRPNPTACAWMGRGRHAVTYYVRGGALVNFVGVVEREDWKEEGWSIPGDAAELREDFKNWHPAIAAILDEINPDQLFKWALYDREPLTRWTDGRAALLGDAAHPMLPFLAQGAAMAAEDAIVLAQEISKPDRAIAKSLSAYQRQRLDRCSRVQAASRANMNIFHQRSTLGQAKTYGPMWLAGKLTPALVHKRMDWIYGHDVTRG